MSKAKLIFILIFISGVAPILSFEPKTSSKVQTFKKDKKKSTKNHKRKLRLAKARAHEKSQVETRNVEKKGSRTDY
jgi:hypothetical protein